MFEKSIKEALKQGVRASINLGSINQEGASASIVNKAVQQSLWKVIKNDFSKKFEGGDLFKDTATPEEMIQFLNDELKRAKLAKETNDRSQLPQHAPRHVS